MFLFLYFCANDFIVNFQDGFVLVILFFIIIISKEICHRQEKHFICRFAVLKNEISLKRVGSIYDLGFPLYIKKIDAAVIFGRSKKTYYFAGKLYWRFNEKRQKMDKGYPKKISPIWKGLPPNLDSALTWRNGVTYFFKGK